MLDKVIKERILKAPENSYVIPGTTPVISFGDFKTAEYATIGINPSSQEFCDLKGQLLVKKRLADYETLNLNFQDRLDDTHAEIVWKSCQEYFKPNNAYDWFAELEEIVSVIGLTYSSGKMCHIDLVQWATFPAWREIPPKQRKILIQEDQEFFAYQLQTPNIKTFLINGKEIYDQVSKMKEFNFEVSKVIPYESGTIKKELYFYSGSGPNNKKVLAWSNQLHALRVSNPERKRIYSELTNWLTEEIN